MAWDVARVEVDNDTSASGKRERPGFEAVLSAIEQGEVSAVISCDMARLTRNRRDTVRVIQIVQRYNTEFEPPPVTAPEPGPMPEEWRGREERHGREDVDDAPPGSSASPAVMDDVPEEWRRSFMRFLNS